MRGGFTYRLPYDCTQPCSVNANPSSCSPKYSTMSLRSNSPCTSTSSPSSSWSLSVRVICSAMNASYSAGVSLPSCSFLRALRTSVVCGNEPIVVVGNSGSRSGFLRRTSLHAARREKQLRPPLVPATTIGSFPQTTEVRNARKKLHDGKLTSAEYDAFIAEQITRTLKLQEELGLDVLVHGEFERNDMVEYFGEQLEGFAFTEHGWVQSYGSRYVKPPIIYGDVSRPKAMTVRWSTFAQSKTARPVKGMLTGPVTILQWSFVRDDQPRAETAKQLALAIRDEVTDLAAAGI